VSVCVLGVVCVFVASAVYRFVSAALGSRGATIGYLCSLFCGSSSNRIKKWHIRFFKMDERHKR
jgi:hypothetical protein